MAMSWSSKLFQEGSSYLRQQFTGVCVCSSRPLTLAAARGTSSTGCSLAVSSSGAAGDFSYSSGDQANAGGYKLTLAACTGITVHDAGTAQHVALTGSSYVLYVTTCTTIALTTANTVSVPSFDLMDISGPSSS